MKKKFAVFLILMTLLGIVNAQDNYWSPIIGNQYTMTVTGVIVINEVQQSVTTLEIGAFCGDECRASHFAQLFPQTGDYVVTMTIRSRVNSGETISFRLYDHVTQQELDLECLNTIEYVANTQIGSINDWYQFAFASAAIQNVTPGDWSNANNWSGGILPGVNDAVIITRDCNIDMDVEVASLTINDNVAITILEGNTLVVNGTLVNNIISGLVIEDGAQVINNSDGVKAVALKNILAYTSKSANGWHLISSPVDDMDIDGTEFILETYDLYRYNETWPGWENYRLGHDDFRTFDNGWGYLYANSNTFSPGFQGVLNSTDIIRELTYTEWYEGQSGVNIIGNPFPHLIYKGHGGAIDDDRLASGYFKLNYYGGWDTYTYETPIMPGQGFVVRATENMDLTIKKKTTPSDGEVACSKDGAGRLKIDIEGSRNRDCAYAYFCDGIGLEKMENFSQTLPTLAIINDDTEYAIAHLDDDCESIDLVFRTMKEDYYQLTFEVTDMTFDYLHLIDFVTGNNIDLLNEHSYMFYANGTEDENRFKLMCRDFTGISENTVNGNFAHVSGNNIVVIGEGTLEVIDMTGRIVKTLTVNGIETVKNPSDGIYVLRFVNGDTVKTQKIVVSQ